MVKGIIRLAMVHFKLFVIRERLLWVKKQSIVGIIPRNKDERPQKQKGQLTVLDSCLLYHTVVHCTIP